VCQLGGGHEWQGWWWSAGWCRSRRRPLGAQGTTRGGRCGSAPRWCRPRSMTRPWRGGRCHGAAVHHAAVRWQHGGAGMGVVRQHPGHRSALPCGLRAEWRADPGPGGDPNGGDDLHRGHHRRDRSLCGGQRRDRQHPGRAGRGRPDLPSAATSSLVRRRPRRDRRRSDPAGSGARRPPNRREASSRPFSHDVGWQRRQAVVVVARWC
jgi:hypothetical protein